MNFRFIAKKLAKRHTRLTPRVPEAGSIVTTYRLAGRLRPAGAGRRRWAVKNVLAGSDRGQTVALSSLAVAAVKEPSWLRRAGRTGTAPETPAQAAEAAPAAPAASGLPDNAFARLVQDMGGDRGAAIEAIRDSFPASMLKDAGAYFDVPATRIRAIARVPETTAAALAKRGASLDAGASERLWRLADVVTMAEDVFEDGQTARTWLRTSNRTFHDAEPRDYLDTEPGAMAVRRVLNAIATGGAV